MEETKNEEGKMTLKDRIIGFNAEYRKNMKTPAISRLWFYVAIVIAFGLFIIYGVLGGDPGLYHDLAALGFMKGAVVCMVYVGLMTLALWPIGIFLETVRKVNMVKAAGNEK